MSAAITEIRGHVDEQVAELRGELREQYFTRDQIKLAFPSYRAQRLREARLREVALVAVGVLAAAGGVSSLLQNLGVL